MNYLFQFSNIVKAFIKYVLLSNPYVYYSVYNKRLEEFFQCLTIKGWLNNMLNGILFNYLK